MKSSRKQIAMMVAGVLTGISLAEGYSNDADRGGAADDRIAAIQRRLMEVEDAMAALSAKRARMSALNDERIRLEAELEKKKQNGLVPHE